MTVTVVYPAPSLLAPGSEVVHGQVVGAVDLQQTMHCVDETGDVHLVGHAI